MDNPQKIISGNTNTHSQEGLELRVPKLNIFTRELAKDLELE
jgi:hypothetical protein